MLSADDTDRKKSIPSSWDTHRLESQVQHSVGRGVNICKRSSVGIKERITFYWKTKKSEPKVKRIVLESYSQGWNPASMLYSLMTLNL